MTKSPNIIAIDGTVASGKGTLARKLAQSLNFAHLDTGKIYRAVGFTIIGQYGSDQAHTLSDSELESLALKSAQTLSMKQVKNPVLIQDDVGQMASKVAKFPSVRNALKQFQQDFANNPPDSYDGAILDGRDIGTVICPHAPLKLYVTADAEIRARRRYEELINSNIKTTYETVLEELKQRDRRDINRSIAPLRPTDDAVILDTSQMNIEQVLQIALNHAKDVFKLC